MDKQQHSYSSESQRPVDSHVFFAKITALLVFMLADLLLNSSIEYDTFAVATGGALDPIVIAVLFLTGQLLLQVAVLLTLFIMMFDTWPFQGESA